MMLPPLETIDAYARAFDAQRADQVVRFYELPCTFIRPDGTWVVQEEATALVLVRHLFDHARTQGHRRTEIARATVRLLAASLAEVTGVFVRRDAAGAQVARSGYTYILRGGAEGWRIVVAVAHDAETAAQAPLTGSR